MTSEEIERDKTTTISEEERFSDNLNHPSRYFIVNAFGEGVYFHTRSRQTAQKWADILYGEGHYIVRAAIQASVT